MKQYEFRIIPSRDLSCPKCHNWRLYPKYLGENRNMTYYEINECLKNAKKFDKCRFTSHQLENNYYSFIYIDENGNPPPTFTKANTVWAFFCRCGYYSLNPYDFNDRSKYDDPYNSKVLIQRDKEIFTLREEIYKLQEENKLLNNNLMKENQRILNMINSKIMKLITLIK